MAELPPLAVEISEHRLQRVCCPDCGRKVRVELPAGVPRGCFGPKLEAAIASLTVRNRLSRRQLLELMEELFGCPIAIGTVDAILTRTGETLEPVYDELLEQTRAAGALNIDETGWYLGGEPRTATIPWIVTGGPAAAFPQLFRKGRVGSHSGSARARPSRASQERSGSEQPD